MKIPTLGRSADFDLVYAQGRRSVCDALVLLHLENAPERRVAFVASRKVGGAVARNRSKRVMREAFRQVADDLPEEWGWMVLIARREILQLKSHEVAERLRALLSGLRAQDGSPVHPLS